MKKFKKISKRIDNIAIRNFYIENDTIKDLTHLKDVKFSHVEIVKYQPNKYYGKEDEYILNGEMYTNEESPTSFIAKSCFKSKETCFTLAYYEINFKDDYASLKYVSDRPFELDKTETKAFHKLAKYGQKEINKNFKR